MTFEAVLRAPLRSAAFRFAVLLALIFAIGAGALLFTVRSQIGNYAAEATSGRLKAEIAILGGEYAQLGQSGLTDAIARHQSVGDDAQFHYLLVDAQRRRLAGDLPVSAARVGTYALEMVEHDSGPISGRLEKLTALGTSLPDGLTLVVATDNFDVLDLRSRLLAYTLLSGVGITLFVLVGGFLAALIFLRRLERVNLAVSRIVEGERKERLPMIGFGPEFDGLARNLNIMLDRNEAAMEALRQVSTDIAHDLRTPLTRLHQQLEQMQDADPIEPSTAEAALAQTSGLLATFNALLRIGTVEGGIGRRRFKAVDLSELMDRIQQLYEPVAEDGDHHLLADHAGNILVHGDGELLTQLVINLIENALVHTPAGTRITSRLRYQGTSPVIEICDDGPGIPADEREKVFGRFYRLDASRNTEGSGLGLALVAAIANLHQAHCTICGDGAGMCVQVIFPTLQSQG
ncbi:HAMP domain-containing protein [Sphingobium sp. PAMC28499]|uniref:sensor histidine kinase n=1 Tax=Sphingobium sp. PAMC28499 TaxID=2565554 RepID=UPI00109D8FC9|nr:ATP-binding protein [Sphingobium sp. PAMC28499]QCB36669.1 HAMP domain-containing protein [Sphingobium sp. PAMC28499]